MTKFNMMIQAILDGNSRNASDQPMLPIIQSEEVVLDMFVNELIPVSLQHGWLVSQFSQKSRDLLLPRERFLVQDKQSETTNDHHMARFIPYQSSITSPALIMSDERYFLDSAAIADNGHLISGITLGKKRYFYDSNVGKKV